MLNSLVLSVVLVSFANCNIKSSPHVSVEETFRTCLITQPSLNHCIGVGALSKLQSLDSDPQFDLIDGLTLTRNEQEYRLQDFNFAERDPSDFRNIIESFGHVFAHRNMFFDMSFLYPGLAMRVAPSASPGGVLEFVLDPHIETVNTIGVKEMGTGRLLARQFLVPFLLGFKFNVATIIPILFGILALIAKKAVFISKLALIASSAFGLGSILLNNNGNKVQQQQNYHSSPTFNPGFGNHHYTRFPTEEYHDVVYRGINENNDQLRLIQENGRYGSAEEKSKGRNFAWSEDEKSTTD